MKWLIGLLLVLCAPFVTALTVEPTVLELAGEPGSFVGSSFILRNNENQQRTISIVDATVSRGNEQVSLGTFQTFQLAPQAQQTVEFGFSLNAGQLAGLYTGRLRFLDSTTGAQLSTLNVELDVAARPDISVAPIAATAPRGGSAVFDMLITNSGNTDETLTITKADLTGPAVIPASQIFVTSPFPLAHGTSGEATVRVQLGLQQPLGTYSGTFIITSSQGQIAVPVTLSVTEPVHTVVIEQDIELGSNTQERESSASETFTIKNKGNFVEEVILSHSLASKFDAELSSERVVIQPGESASVTLEITVPDDQSSERTKIGELTAGFADKSVKRGIFLTAESQLELKLHAIVGGKRDTNVGDDDTIGESASPQEDITLEIELKNLFSKSEDLLIEDIDIEITAEEFDDGDDLELDASVSSLKPQQKTVETFTFKVPAETRDGDYRVVITVRGEDENGALHTVSTTAALEVEREKDDLRITEVRVPSSVACGGSALVQVSVENFGSRRQSDAGIDMLSNELKIQEKDFGFRLEADPGESSSRHTSTFKVSVPSGKSGEFQFTVTAYYEASRLKAADRKIVTLKVDSCSTPQQPVSPKPVPEPSEPQQPSQEIPVAKEVPFLKSQPFVLILIAANLALVLAILGMLVVLVKK